MRLRATILLLLFTGCVQTPRTKPPLPPALPHRASAITEAIPPPPAYVVYQSFPGQVSTCENIQRNPAGGWFTVARGNYPISNNSILRWTNGSDLALTTLDIFFDAGVDSGFHGIVSGKLIFGGFVAAGNPCRIGEFDMNTGQKLLEVTYGDGSDRQSTATMLANGGLAGVTFNDTEVGPNPHNAVRFDAFYRKPSAVISSNNWWFKRFEIPSTAGSAALRYLATTVQDSKGTIWVFFTRDSSGTIGLLQFETDAFGLRLVFQDQNWIGTGSPVAPSGEFPVLSSVLDGQGHVLLGYQTVRTMGSPCHEIDSYWNVVQVSSDRTVVSLGETEWLSPHGEFPKPAIMPRPDGIYYMLLEEPIGTCDIKHDIGLLHGGSYAISQRLGDGKVLSFSPDGWVLFHDRSQIVTDTKLLKVRFRPKMTIAKASNKTIVDWDESLPTDLLQASSDFQNWSEPYASGRPVTVPLVAQPQYFRVRQ